MLTLYTIGTFMDRDGFAFPNQDTIAKGSRNSVRTVRRHVDQAVAAGWLSVSLAGRGGQGWRHQSYRACVPDHIDLGATDDAISDSLSAQFGDTEAPAKPVTARPPEAPDKLMTGAGIERADTSLSSPSDREGSRNPPETLRLPEAPDIGSTKHRTNGTEGPDKSTPSTGHSYGRLTPALRTPASRTHTPEEARPAPSAGLKQPDSQEQRDQRIRKLLEAMPTTEDSDVAKMISGVSIADVRRVREARAA